MIIFRYDKTFEGLLTCVFDAYSRKTFPDRLLGSGDIEPLFTDELHAVISDREKSNRVWKSLERKLTKNGRNMLIHVWLSETAHADELIFRFIRKVTDSAIAIETDYSDEDVLKMIQTAKKVSKEAEFVRQFIRFRKTSDGIFFGALSLAYNALPLAVNHFIHRFVDQRWIIYDLKRDFGYYYDLNTTIEISLKHTGMMTDGNIDARITDKDEQLFQEMWKSYFNAIAISERINPRLQRQHLPKRFWKYLTEKQ
ncbi:MAG: TIGR03915 family putative DNA repair protein [Prevotellaceae bacterium]|jgi:probable DNA metabolism protein|nr:TIGR03915 family putative DNA repair protein [Prevotellaceae bacterium]